MASEVGALPQSTTGVWESVSAWGSSVKNWLNENVWQAVLPVFNGIGKFVRENGAVCWAALGGALAGAGIMALCIKFCSKTSKEPAAEGEKAKDPAAPTVPESEDEAALPPAAAAAGGAAGAGAGGGGGGGGAHT